MKGENRYPLSRNYKKLKYYLDIGLMMVCFVDFKMEGGKGREVCTAYYDDNANEDFRRYVFRAGGREYAAWNESLVKVQDGYPKTFEEKMKMHHVEFIDFD